jgi:hypothetical protein
MFDLKHLSGKEIPDLVEMIVQASMKPATQERNDYIAFLAKRIKNEYEIMDLCLWSYAEQD